MPVASSVRERCQELLEPGEQIRYLFPATSAVMSIGVVAAPFFVAVTDRAVVLISGKFLRRNRPDQIWSRFPGTRGWDRSRRHSDLPSPSAASSSRSTRSTPRSSRRRMPNWRGRPGCPTTRSHSCEVGRARR